MRKIIHIDMDCFFAAVEVRDNPYLKGLPVAVGGAKNRRGVISTCNYEARKYGVHSAMPTYVALRKCPTLLVLPINMQKYINVSQNIHNILKTYTNIIEPLSLDEAFLDVSNTTKYSGSASLMAEHIRQEIYEKERITSSAGISVNKFLAKIASDWHKPNGQFVITPDDIGSFVNNLKIEKIHGVGKVTAKKLQRIGIRTCSDLQKLDLSFLINTFGKYGITLYNLSRGKDDREVETYRIRKSLSVEDTYPCNLTSLDECQINLQELYTKLIKRLSKYPDKKISTQFIKIKFVDFVQRTAESKAKALSFTAFSYLFDKITSKMTNINIRLLGVGVRFRENSNNEQLILEL